MSQKKKPAENSDDGSYVEPNTNPDLEKKVDELMSVEEPAPKKVKINFVDTDPEPELEPEPIKIEEPAATEPSAESAPLLPSEKLPDLDKKKPIKVTVHEDEPEEEAETAPDLEEESVLESEPEPEPEIEQEPELGPEPEPPAPVPTKAPPKPVEAVNTDTPLLEDESAPAAPVSDDLGMEDASTSRAVDDIVAHEADELLEAHDRYTHVEPPAAKASAPKGNIFKRIIGGWWHNRLLRNTTFLLLFLGIGAAAAVPSSRYYVLNTAGVRASSTVTVLDETNGQPLKNASFKVGETTGKTDSDGIAKLDNLKLGPTTFSVQKPAFAEVSQPVTIGWGSNPLGEFKMKAVGLQYTFKLSDFVSGKGLAKVEASSGSADARSNDKGELVLTMPKNIDQDNITVQITADDYRSETIKLAATTKDPTSVKLVPSKKHVFVSKRSGKFDVFKIDVDGKNEEKVLEGTGLERSEAMAISTHPTKNIAALVSTREDVRNKDGYNLSTLTIIDLSDNSTTKAAQSERIQLVDWIGNKLIYVKIAEGESAASTSRHRLVSYDLNSHSEHELASTNYFNDVVAVNDSIYYSPAMYQVNGQVGLYKINAEGNNRKQIYDKEVWNLFRTGYDKMSASVGSDWYDLNLTNDNLTKAGGAPPVLKSRVYYDNLESTASLWVDERDGKGVLLDYNKDSKEDKVLQTKAGLKNPVRWLDSTHYIYRVSTTQETADYVASTDGGEPIKIRDVTDTGGIDRWYYY